MYFVIRRHTQNSWRWSLYSDDHQRIADGTRVHSSEQGCLEDIHFLKTWTSTAPVYDESREEIAALIRTTKGGGIVAEPMTGYAVPRLP